MKEIYIKLVIIFSILTVFLFSYCAIDNTNKETVNNVEEEKEQINEPVMVSVTVDNTVNSVDLDTYLLGVVAGEMPASFELEALKAQVVASRTFVYNRGLSVDNTTDTQVYLSDEKMKENWQGEYVEKKNKIEQAISETQDQVMMYQGEYISALFFSSSNGYTENSNDYFIGASVPYLQSVESPWDLKMDPNIVRSKSFTKSELQEVFNTTTLGFNITSYKKSGRVETLNVDGKEYTGREVRELLSLSSSSFTVALEDNQYVFTSTGSGHGVGMSQYGAQGMALEGYMYTDILKHYYTNVEIVNN